MFIISRIWPPPIPGSENNESGFTTCGEETGLSTEKLGTEGLTIFGIALPLPPVLKGLKLPLRPAIMGFPCYY